MTHEEASSEASSLTRSKEAMEKAEETHLAMDSGTHDLMKRINRKKRCAHCRVLALALDDFAAQRERELLDRVGKEWR